MGAPLFLSRRSASFQPQQTPQIDRGNPLTSGLIAGVIPSQRVDFVTGRQYTQGGTYATAAAQPGVGLVTDGNAAYIVAPIPQIVLTQWTIMAVVRANAPAVDARAVSLANSTTNTPYIPLGTGTSDVRQVRVLAQSDSGSLPANQSSVGFGFDGPTRVLAMTYDGNNVRCYIDGVLDTTAPTSSGATWTVNQFAVGAQVRTSAVSFWKGSTFLATAHKRALSDAEIKSLSANPWQLLVSPQRILPLATTAGTSVAISAAWLEANDSTSLAASVSVTGSATWTEASDIASIGASIAVSSTANWTESNDASAITAAAKVSASASWSESSDTTAITGTAAVNASPAWTEVADVTAISATIGNAVSASAAWTESNDTASLTASVQINTSGAWTEASDIAAIAASVGNSVAGNLAWTEANDAAAITATAKVNVSGAWAEVSDTITALATVRVDASAGWGEQSDLTGFSAAVLARANIAWTEASDTAALTASSGAPGGTPDASTISASRTVNFGGGTNRVNFGGGTNRVNF